jgi:hypothetical protein
VRAARRDDGDPLGREVAAPPCRQRLDRDPVALALDEDDSVDEAQETASRSTTKTSGSFGLITPPPAPRSP